MLPPSFFFGQGLRGSAAAADGEVPARAAVDVAAAAAEAETNDVNHKKVARELFEAMDQEGSGRVGFTTFLAACLAGRPADEAGARVAFSWLDRRQKDAIDTGDMKLFTGEVRGVCFYLLLLLLMLSLSALRVRYSSQDIYFVYMFFFI